MVESESQKKDLVIVALAEMMRQTENKANELRDQLREYLVKNYSLDKKYSTSDTQEDEWDDLICDWLYGTIDPSNTLLKTINKNGKKKRISKS